MSKKVLLKEGTVRRFMTLANIGSLSNRTVDVLREQDDIEEEGFAEEEVDEVLPGGEELEAELGVAEFGEEGPLDAGVSDEAEANEKLADELADRLAPMIVDVLDDLGADVEEEEDVDDGEGVEVDIEGAEAEVDVGGEEEDLEVSEEDLEALEENLVNTVASRVAARLLTADR